MNELKIKGIYKHFKGDYYIVEDMLFIVKQKKNILFIVLYMVIIIFI